jgi:hypothetical protein
MPARELNIPVATERSGFWSATEMVSAAEFAEITTPQCCKRCCGLRQYLLSVQQILRLRAFRIIAATAALYFRNILKFILIKEILIGSQTSKMKRTYARFQKGTK